MGGYVGSLRKKPLPAGNGDPSGEAKNNYDAPIEIGKLFGPIAVDVGK
jgi:hypothetical protein